MRLPETHERVNDSDLSSLGQTFGSAQCAKCSRWISSSDWVRRARDSQAEQIYHLACFACDACHRQLSTGEEFALVEKKLLCKTHYQETVESDESEEQEGGDPDDNTRVRNKSKTKRVRTTFTDEQLQILQANFQIDSNPDGQDLERIAQITGLSKRVTQVWFQNSRARQKKHVGGKHSAGE
ncbi:LIM/homeobox protein Awh [Orchesella cincta]|uniref:LIM/homeobox protein Awh n=1 Tax=Orchesella cincta TaxID=48709 RepID=A0A1D2NHM1_ORCCI|nr:LIM/homeobox protein Awh [Orchesella cincta]